MPLIKRDSPQKPTWPSGNEVTKDELIAAVDRFIEWAKEDIEVERFNHEMELGAWRETIGERLMTELVPKLEAGNLEEARDFTRGPLLYQYRAPQISPALGYVDHYEDRKRIIEAFADGPVPYVLRRELWMVPDRS